MNMFGKKKEEEPAGRIYNTVMPDSAPEEAPAPAPSKKDAAADTTPKAPTAEDDDDWSAVPAFLRRGKK